MIWDYVFIGAGPATLAAVNKLTNHCKPDILILEAGQDAKRQICPGLKAGTCTSCLGEACHVLNGVGGASATFGNKMCHFPASSGIRRYVEENSAGSVISDIEGMLASVSGSINEHGAIPYPGTPNRKTYSSDIIFMDDYRKMLAGIADQVSAVSELRVGVRVDNVEHDSVGMFCVVTDAGDVIRSKNVVVATGRSGHRNLRQWLDELRIPYVENQADIGIRIEVDTDQIAPGFLYQNDPKYKFDFGELGSARTFCTCKGGHIIPVKHGNWFFADGAFLRRDTGRTNVALMARTKNLVTSTAIEEWCTDVNQKADGSLLLGELDLASLSSNDLVHGVLDLVPSWPSPEHGKLIEQLLRKILGGEYVTMVHEKARKSATMRVFGPSIDLYWPQPDIRKGFGTSVDGLWIIGDATGHSRGILQALTSGASWAQHQLSLRGESLAHEVAI